MSTAGRGVKFWAQVADWLGSDDTGISSRAICTVMMGGIPAPHNQSVPSDCWDFGRCYRLLKRFPQWRRNLAKMNKLGKDWRALVKAWPKLERLYEKNPGQWNDELYDAMQKVIWP